MRARWIVAAVRGPGRAGLDRPGARAGRWFGLHDGDIRGPIAGRPGGGRRGPRLDGDQDAPAGLSQAVQVASPGPAVTSLPIADERQPEQARVGEQARRRARLVERACRRRPWSRYGRDVGSSSAAGAQPLDEPPQLAGRDRRASEVDVVDDDPALPEEPQGRPRVGRVVAARRPGCPASSGSGSCRAGRASAGGYRGRRAGRRAAGRPGYHRRPQEVPR